MEQAVTHLFQDGMAKARHSQERHHIEQGILPVGPQVWIALDELLIGVGQGLKRIFEDVFCARAIAGGPEVFSDGDQRIHGLITVLSHHIQRIDTHRIVGVGQIDQHHVIPLTRGKEPAQGMHDVAVRLDERQPGSICTNGVGSQSARSLRQMLEERTFALARAGHGQQVMAQTLLGQEDRYLVPCMTGDADLPALAHRQLWGRQCRAGASPLQERQIGQITRLGQVPEHRDIGHAEDVA